MFAKTFFTILSTIGLALCGPVKIPGSLYNSKGNVNPFIVGSEIVQGREFPGLVSVNIRQFHFCSGLILNSEWILSTASGQWQNPDNVLVGTNQMNNGGTVHMLKEIILHERYNESDSWINDIALLRLATPIQFTEGVSPVTLPEEGEETPVGSPGVIAGWGQLDYMGDLPNDLHKLAMTVYDHKSCEDNYAFYNKTVYPTQICARPVTWGNGPAFGDSADPLIVDGKVIGLVSWERGNNSEGNAVVMTKISEFIDWINKHISA